MELLDFIKKNPTNTDKVALGYVNEFYDRIFSPIRNDVKNVLEIGIYQGASIKLWRDFFHNAIIHGFDVNRCAALDQQDRIVQNIQDAYSEACYSKVANDYYDIIIDDGPHTLQSMEVFLKQYFPKVKSGGLLVLEDIINTTWTPLLVDMIDTDLAEVEVVHMANKQIDPRLKEGWKNGLDVIIVRKK